MPPFKSVNILNYNIAIIRQKMGKCNLQVAGLVQLGDLAAAPGDSSVHGAAVAGNTAKASC